MKQPCKQQFFMSFIPAPSAWEQSAGGRGKKQYTSFAYCFQQKGGKQSGFFGAHIPELCAPNIRPSRKPSQNLRRLPKAGPSHFRCLTACLGQLPAVSAARAERRSRNSPRPGQHLWQNCSPSLRAAHALRSRRRFAQFQSVIVNFRDYPFSGLVLSLNSVL